MSIRKDESGRRWVAAEVEVPGTPEEVWAAIATAEGVSSWFVPTEMREDGAIVSHFGPGMDAVARQTAWDPPRSFTGEGEMAPGVKMATEWIVEARSGGTCVVRVVHSLFASTDDWDNQLEQIERGWPDYFEILRLYLTHFLSQAGTCFQLLGMTNETASAAWDKVAAGLGLENARTGERRQAPAGAPRWSGLVEQSRGSEGHARQVLLRVDEPAAGIAHMFANAMGGIVVISIRFYLFGPGAADVARAQEPVWQQWLMTQFPPPGAPPCG